MEDPIHEAYGRFRQNDQKRRLTVREHLFDMIVEVLAYFHGVENARPPDDGEIERLKAELDRRTFDALQKARDHVTLAGIQEVRDNALSPDLLAILKDTGITTPGHLLMALKHRDMPGKHMKEVLDYLGLQRKGGRPPRKGQGDGEAGGDSG